MKMQAYFVHIKRLIHRHFSHLIRCVEVLSRLAYYRYTPAILKTPRKHTVLIYSDQFITIDYSLFLETLSSLGFPSSS